MVIEVTATAKKGKRATLFQKLSAIEGTEGDATEALDKWVAEGKTVKSSNVLCCVNRLLKGEKYKHAAQVCEWMEKGKNNVNNADDAVCTDLHAKTEVCEWTEKSKNNLNDDDGAICLDLHAKTEGCEWMEECKNNLNNVVSAKCENLNQRRNH